MLDKMFRLVLQRDDYYSPKQKQQGLVRFCSQREYDLENHMAYNCLPHTVK